ncbi:MAG: glycosyltransferase, partial [Chloroflexi bacterium]|nr:glycosyltransferase [Chloroflexota bacterium]
EGFPGWHIECSAMSRKYLGEHLDLHTGGVDNIFPHHEGELAQSEAAFGGPYVQIWAHGQHLLADGVKMAKSVGNAYILDDIIGRRIQPLAFRYLCATAHFRTRLNFTFTALKAAERGYTRLTRMVRDWARRRGPYRTRPELLEEWRRGFWERVDDNLDVPGALAVLWLMADSELNPRERLALALEFDRFLGFGLESAARLDAVPKRIRELASERQRLRSGRNYRDADGIRDRIRRAGFYVQDGRNTSRLVRMTEWERAPRPWLAVSSPGEIGTNIGRADTCAFTVALQANGPSGDVERCVRSVMRHTANRDCELLVLDNAAPEATGRKLEDLRKSKYTVRVLHADQQLGEAAAKNVLLKQASGQIVVLLEPYVELTGDLLRRLEELLRPPEIGVAGPYGLKSRDLHDFHEVRKGPVEVDAMQAYCFAFKRAALAETGLLPQSYRFYRNLDLDLSFRFRDRGYRIVADPTLPVKRHEHRAWAEMPKAQREQLSRENFRRFTRRWGKRTDLLVSASL